MVVEVAETARYRWLDEPPEPFVFLPIFAELRFRRCASRALRAALMPMVEQAVHELDPELPVFDVSNMDSQLR